MKVMIREIKNLWAFLKGFVIGFTTVITFFLLYSMYVLYQETHIIDAGFIVLCITLFMNSLISLKYFVEMNIGILRVFFRRKK